MEIISFGAFRLYPSQRVLKKGDQPVKLGSRAFDILLVLVQHAGKVVGHKELVAKVWPGVFVEEVSRRVHIAALRKALDTGEAGARYLINVPGRGYCFVAPTSREWVESGVPAAEMSFDAVYRLPPPLARMVGREETVREVCQKLIAERFVSIVRPGGSGKTTVALAVAHALLIDFRGAVCNNASLRKAARHLGKLYDAVLEPSGLKATQFSLLTQIHALGQPTMAGLASSLLMDLSAMRHSLGPLIRDGLILLRVDANDRRVKRVILTAAGVTKFKQAMQLWRKAQGRFEKASGSARAAKLHSVLKLLTSEGFEDAFQAALERRNVE
jgi:DNA-binding winged helix-turn-helix (wHTH) protein/DNA-binding MarR family transcriptional regulator